MSTRIELDVLTGEVIAVDGTTGLGAVRGEDGTEYLFHVVEIVDGTRSIDVGARVLFQPLPKFGRFQAGRIRTV